MGRSDGQMVPELSHLGLDQKEWVMEWGVILVLGRHEK